MLCLLGTHGTNTKLRGARYINLLDLALERDHFRIFGTITIIDICSCLFDLFGRELNANVRQALLHQCLGLLQVLLLFENVHDMTLEG